MSTELGSKWIKEKSGYVAVVNNNIGRVHPLGTVQMIKYSRGTDQNKTLKMRLILR